MAEAQKYVIVTCDEHGEVMREPSSFWNWLRGLMTAEGHYDHKGDASMTVRVPTEDKE